LLHLHHGLHLPRAGFNLDEDGLAAFRTLVAKNLH